MKQYDANGYELLGKLSEEDKKEWYLLFAELSFLAAKVNNETDFCVFFELMGHVGGVRIKICESKKNYNKELILSEFPVKWEGNEQYTSYTDFTSLTQMRRKKVFMTYILENHDIPYDSAIREEITHIEEVWSF